MKKNIEFEKNARIDFQEIMGKDTTDIYLKDRKNINKFQSRIDKRHTFEGLLGLVTFLPFLFILEHFINIIIEIFPGKTDKSNSGKS